MLFRSGARYHGNLTNVEDLSLALAVRELVLAAERHRAQSARDLVGVGGTEMIALGIVQVDGRQTPSELARKLDITTASATELLDRLARAGLIERQPHPTDRRKILVGLTPAAQAAVTAVYRRLDDVLADARPPDAQARAAVADFLRDAATALRTAAGSPARQPSIGAATLPGVSDSPGLRS
jgi:DNA-binding MarR family transcriptional regulator